MILFSWTSVALYLRAATFREKARDYVAAGRLLGASTSRIIFVHILPNSIATIVTFLPFLVAGAIASQTALDYLGFGIPPANPVGATYSAKARLRSARRHGSSPRLLRDGFRPHPHHLHWRRRPQKPSTRKNSPSIVETPKFILTYTHDSDEITIQHRVRCPPGRMRFRRTRKPTFRGPSRTCRRHYHCGSSRERRAFGISEAELFAREPKHDIPKLAEEFTPRIGTNSSFLASSSCQPISSGKTAPRKPNSDLRKQQRRNSRFLYSGLSAYGSCRRSERQSRLPRLPSG